MHYYNLCSRHVGKVVRINDRLGRCHVGRIMRVTRSHVYIMPHARNLGGFGYGFYGGYGYGFRPFAVPLAFITGFALGGLLFW